MKKTKTISNKEVKKAITLLEEKSLSQNFSNYYTKAWADRLNNDIYKLFKFSNKCSTCGRVKKHTPACIEKTRLQALKNKRFEASEKKRKAELVTMTVGELEERIREASNDYD